MNRSSAILAKLLLSLPVAAGLLCTLRSPRLRTANP
jgi:hypothetical protein